jgi:hypothetical protein
MKAAHMTYLKPTAGEVLLCLSYFLIGMLRCISSERFYMKQKCTGHNDILNGFI